MGDIMEYRLRLEDGNVLVWTFEVLEADEPIAGPASIREGLMQLLGVGVEASGRKPARSAARSAPRAKQIVRPVEPSAEEWLEATSRDALGKMK